MHQATFLRAHPHAGRVHVQDAEGRTVLAGAYAAVALAEGTVFTTESAEPELTADGWQLVAAGTPASPELRWRIALDGPGAVVELEVTNTLPYALSIERLDVLVVPEGFLGIPARRLTVAQTGWQSWSFASPPVPYGQHPRPASPPKLAPGGAQASCDGWLVPWVALLTAGDRRLLAGFISAKDQQGVVAIQPTPTAHCLTASCHAEGHRLEPGETLRAEPLLLLLDLPDDEALAWYADTLARRMAARVPGRVSTGWSSWYYFFTRVSEQDVVRNMAALEAGRDRLPVELVQLDDGYQTAIGDWLSLNAKFPSGMRALSDAIHAKGYQAGIWVAPFLVSEHSRLYAKHPHWVLRDAQGEPINAITNWESRNFGLDTTHPEVEAWLKEVFRTIVEDWGFDYLKLDFVYAAAMRARRFAPGATSVQAYRRGFEIIRSVVGDRFILGCGAPFAPSVGLVDGMRVGPDTAPNWRHPDPSGAEPSLENAIRSTLAHGWMHGRWWSNDPDCVIVRADASELTLAEVRTWASVVALSGGMVLFSDDLSRLEPERAAILPRLLPASNQAAVPCGPAIAGLATGLRLRVERPWETWTVAGLFNWEPAARPLVFDPLAWGMSERRPYHLLDLWSGEHWGPLTGPTLLPVTAPHGVRLLAVHAHQGRPQVVGTTFHLLGGVVELLDERWEADTLTLRLGGPQVRRGELYVYVPDGYDVAEAPGGAIAHGRLIELPLSYRGEETLTMTFRRL